MRPAIILFIAFCFCSIAHAQKLQTFRNTILFNHTEDWCGPCGEWGWPILDSVIHMQQQDTSFHAYAVTVHETSNQLFLNTALATPRAQNTTPAAISVYPGFVVDNANISNISTLVQYTINGPNINKAIDTIRARVKKETAMPADVAIGFSITTPAQDSVVIKTRAKFLAAASGEYRVAVYAVEDSVMGTQQNQVGIVPHHMVLRGDVQHGTWGQQIVNTSAAVNDEFINYFRMQIPQDWNKDHLSYIAIVYKQNTANNFYEIENATNTTNPASNGISAATVMNAGLRLYPQPAKNIIYLDSQADIPYAQVQLFDLSIHYIATLYTGKLGGSQPMAIQLPQLPAGVYMLTLSHIEGSTLQKIIIE